MTSAPFPRRSLYITSFVLASGGGMVFTLLAKLQDQYGFATIGLGYMTAASFVASPIASLGFAGFADRGHSRRMITTAVALSMAGALMFAFGSHLWQFVVARVMLGFGFGLYQPTGRGLILRNARAVGTGPGAELAKLNGVDIAGFTVGPGFGAALVYFFGIRAPFLVVAAVLPVTAIGLVRRIPAYSAADQEATTAAGRQQLSIQLLRSPHVRVAVLFAIGNFLPVGIYDSLWSRYLKDRGASILFVGLSLSLYGIPYVLAAAQGGRYVDKVGPLRAMRVALIGVVPLVALYGLIPNIWVIAFLALAEAGFGAVVQPAAQAAMAAACPTDRLAAGQGLASAAAALTAAATAMIAAPMYARVGSGGVFGAAAAAVAVIITAGLVLGRQMNWFARVDPGALLTGT